MQDGGAGELASFRGGQLRLTERALHYSGRGLHRRARLEVRLSSVTAVGVTRWFTPYLLASLAPLLMLGPPLLVGTLTQNKYILINGLLLAILLNPFVLVAAWRLVPGYALRIIGDGVIIRTAVGRSRLDEATAFARRTSAAALGFQQGDLRTHHPKTPNPEQESSPT